LFRIASARIERALLPVQRKRTLKMGSDIGGYLWQETSTIGQNGFTRLHGAVAAILDEKRRETPKHGEIRAINDGTAVPLRAGQPRPRQAGKMGRRSIMRDTELPCDLARGKPLRLMFDQEPEHIETGFLSQCGQGLHLSMIGDISKYASKKKLACAGRVLGTSSA
jgi:hypothetical protein